MSVPRGDVRPEVVWLARVGLVARGVVYGVVGILALKLAVGSGGKATTQRGALETIAQEPFGQIGVTLFQGITAWPRVR